MLTLKKMATNRENPTFSRLFVLKRVLCLCLCILEANCKKLSWHAVKKIDPVPMPNICPAHLFGFHHWRAPPRATAPPLLSLGPTLQRKFFSPRKPSKGHFMFPNSWHDGFYEKSGCNLGQVWISHPCPHHSEFLQIYAPSRKSWCVEITQTLLTFQVGGRSSRSHRMFTNRCLSKHLIFRFV